MAAELKQVSSKVNGKAKEPPVARPGGGRWKLAESRRNMHSYRAENDVTLEDLKRPGYWMNVARDIRRDDFIEVRTDDRRKLWLLAVLDVGIGWCDTHLLEAYELPAASSIDANRLDGFDFERDTNGYWFGVRKADGARLGRNHNLPSLKEAQRFVAEHASNRAS